MLGRLTSLIVLLTSALPAQASIISNGGFEEQQAATQPELFSPGQSIAGWLIGGTGRVALNWDPGNAHSGNQFMQLGRSGGAISQLVSLLPGAEYELHFFVYSSTDEPRTPVTYQVGVSTSFTDSDQIVAREIGAPIFAATYVYPGAPGPKYSWLSYSVNFFAEADQERLNFQMGPQSTTNFFMIDDISVSLVRLPVPEPPAGLCFTANLAAAVLLLARVRSEEGKRKLVR